MTGWSACRSSKDSRLINWAAMFGHMADIGGKVPGSMPTDSEQIFEEGIVIPPIKIFSKGQLQKDVLKVILHNCRIPDWNRGDFSSVVAACRTGANRCIEMAQRFGDDLVHVGSSSAAGSQLPRDARTHPQYGLPRTSVISRTSSATTEWAYGPYKIALHACGVRARRSCFDFDRHRPTIARAASIFCSASRPVPHVLRPVYMINVSLTRRSCLTTVSSI